jgi:flagellar biosynthesis anti-sigma factor FlgM
MKIHDSSPQSSGLTSSVSSSKAAELDGASKKTTGRSSGAPAGDIAEFSGLASSIREARAAEEVEIAGRVSKLEALVQSGKYEVDASRLSRKLIDHAISSTSRQES